ncbi:MAG: 30S ribosomal protein S17 [Thermomicrobiales bacterium]
MADEQVTTETAKDPSALAPVARAQGARTQKVGRVVSDKMDKSVVVAVDYVRRHPLYHKRITRTSKFMAHDEQNTCKPGDVVRIEETRPLSKRKRWIVREIIQRGVEI